jgi:hypothetical protein
MKKTKFLFGEVESYFFVINFQASGLAHDHGLLQLINPPWFDVPLNNGVEFLK